MKLCSRKWIAKGMAVTTKGIGFALLLSAISAPASAFFGAPEMDPGVAISAMALLSGSLLLISGRHRST